MSFNFPVTEKKNVLLKNRMETLNIKESDLEEKFVTGSGKGGQNRNKVATCVYLKHKISGIEVKCDIYRTQGLNRYKARDILCKQLELVNHPDASLEIRNKIRKQKDRKRRRK